ncbi:hypothetical protein [Flavobacterium agrisoli]|uniref:Uncharacterized protein n=1 Tax=Flavobacterium agrisoli TaxID=2793066 RepID=A0A934UJN9_9FLAO|nr:hypothetical protein [Flavobacterium agrisoli]MBK0370171.1 hypothetical protein [Flavobacterium agrisoli]
MANAFILKIAIQFKPFFILIFQKEVTGSNPYSPQVSVFYSFITPHLKVVGQIFYKKGFLKKENIGVPFLVATKMVTKFARIAMILSTFIL